MPGDHLVHRLVVGHFVFFLEGVTRLVRVRGGRAGRRRSLGNELAVPVRLRWVGTTRQREAHTHTHTHAPWDKGLLAVAAEKPRIEWAWRLNYPSHL